MAKNIRKQRELYIESARDDAAHAAAAAREETHKFTVSPASLANVQADARGRVPDFLFEGFLTRTSCAMSEPLSGELRVARCALAIRSIELQLVRVESCVYAEGEAREATEVQNIQIADGNVQRGMALPLHMIFPRLFTCTSSSALPATPAAATKLGKPAAASKDFRIEFEVNLIILFADQHVVTENFPITLFR